MSSWDSYVDTLKSYSASEAITEAVIVGKDGCQPWTALTKTINLSDEEKKSISNMIMTKNQPGSITVGGEKFMVLRMVDDDDSLQVFARKKGVGSLCLTTTLQTTIIAFTEEDKVSSAGEANEASKKIAVYLAGLGF